MPGLDKILNQFLYFSLSRSSGFGDKLKLADIFKNRVGFLIEPFYISYVSNDDTGSTAALPLYLRRSLLRRGSSALRMRLCRGFLARNRRHSRRINEKTFGKAQLFRK